MPDTLNDLARVLQLDKGAFPVSEATWHERFPRHDTMGYTLTYDRVMAPWKNSPINFLEIGIADQRFPLGSCAMWRRYFRNAKLYAIDIQPLTVEAAGMGVQLFHGDQGDRALLDKVKQAVPEGFQFIIDDGSHLPGHIIASFESLWPAIVPGGTYFIEDVGPDLRERFRLDNGVILNWVDEYPPSVGGKVEKIRATSHYECYLLAITKE